MKSSMPLANSSWALLGAAVLAAALLPRGALGLVFRASSSGTGAGNSSCPLPADGRWCTLHNVQGLAAPVNIAVYAWNDIVSNSVCNTGAWEVSNLAQFGPPGHALDVGGNIGVYSLLLAAGGWKVTTFEPLPRNVALMRASLCANPQLAANVKLYEVGLGPSDSQCSMISGIDNVGDGHTKCGANASYVPAGYEVRGSFQIRRLDDVMTQDGIGNFDFVKLDVEGYECQVFAGASKLLSGYKPRLIQSEVWPQMTGCTPGDYLQMFTNSGYKVSQDIQCHVPDASAPAGIVDRFMCYQAAGPRLIQQRPRRVLRLSLA